ncbi:unnamed protein product [Prorocentrum cordatum]|uniref:Uncharacterized protein n=1 Tax=Prorocentrum cordatum TaxID=2364126 RepID=A0ABN9WXR9_9DINO|nr:unnamed protein product [Polarella glacialis]
MGAAVATWAWTCDAVGALVPVGKRPSTAGVACAILGGLGATTLVLAARAARRPTENPQKGRRRRHVQASGSRGGPAASGGESAEVDPRCEADGWSQPQPGPDQLFFDILEALADVKA